MKYDLSSKVCGLNKIPIKEDNKELSVKDYCIRGLLYVDEEDAKIGGVEKYTRYKLARRLEDNQNKVIGLNAEEVTKIKGLVGRFFSPYIVGQVYDVLEGETKEDNEEETPKEN